MRSIIFTLFSLILIWQCAAQSKTAHPSNIIAEEYGDLDNDGMEEKVLITETSEVTDYGNIRLIQIYKLIEGQWKLWESSKSAILKSDEGGMMGDPFQEIKIQNGVLYASFYGGSSWRWAYTDKYKYRNGKFQLIGYESNSFRICESWSSFDFNLLEGSVNYSKKIEDCDNEENSREIEFENFIKKGVLITLKNRNEKSLKIISPKYGYELYL